MPISTGYSLINTSLVDVWYDGLYYAPNISRVISYSDLTGGLANDAQLQADLLSSITLIGLTGNMVAAYGGQLGVDKLMSLTRQQSTNTINGPSYETISARNSLGVIESVFNDKDILVGVV